MQAKKKKVFNLLKSCLEIFLSSNCCNRLHIVITNSSSVASVS